MPARRRRVRVRSESLPWSSDEQHQFHVVNLEGGNAGVDVLMLDVIWVPEFAQAGWLLDLTPFLAPAELTPHFPAAIEPAIRNGRVWALPWFMNVGLLYYRKDLLDKYGLRPPETYAELVRHVGRIKSGERDPALDGFLWQGKQYEGMVVNVLEGLWANGTRVLGESGTVFPEPDRAEEVLAFLRALIESGVSPPWVTAADEELTRRGFQDGRAIFLRNWPYAMDLFGQPGSAVRGKVGIASLPRHARGDHPEPHGALPRPGAAAGPPELPRDLRAGHGRPAPSRRALLPHALDHASARVLRRARGDQDAAAGGGPGPVSGRSLAQGYPMTRRRRADRRTGLLFLAPA